MSDLLVRKAEGGFEGTMQAPPAKYYTHRGFIFGSLADGKTKVLNTSPAGDNMSTVRALKLLGTRVERIEDLGNAYEVTGGPYHTPDDVLNVGNSGTTISFMLGLASRAPGVSVFTGDASLRSRPMGPLLEAMNDWGVPCWSTRGNGRLPIVVEHHEDLKPVVEVSGFISQYVSSPIIMAPFAGKDVTVRVRDKVNEPTYVGLTIHTMRMFGVEVIPAEDYQSFTIPAGQTFQPTTFEVPGDFALAAYGLAVAALTGSCLTYTNLDIDSVQPEKGFINFLQAMGADLVIDAQAKTIAIDGSKRLQGIEWDGNDTPDMIPLMAVLCALAEGKSRIYNVEQVRYKESDRISQMLQLNKMGARVTEFRDGLEFEGVEGLQGARMLSEGDHRLAMGWVVAGLMAEGETIVTEAQVASISYPDFLKDMKRLGMDIQVVGET
jgi:3-phosphoshikimate 1-carboxyvinyltransferase